MISLFDYNNGKVIPSTACYIIPELQKIKECYPSNYMKMYHYIFATTCMDASISPYVNLPEDSREEVILQDVKPDFSLEDPILLAALDKCKLLYDTPVLRSFKGAKKMLDKVATYLAEEEITGGKNGNAADIRGLMKELPDYWASYKKWEAILKEEQAVARGKAKISYDQQPTYKNTKEEGAE
jgi:hypothetical protein